MSTYEIGSIVFDKWKICRELGQGSYGTVYEIQREDFGGVYKAALKVITVPQSGKELQSVLDEGMTPPQAKQYFYSVVEDIGRECAIMSRIKGTGNIVSYEDHAVLRHPDGIGWDILIRMELLHPLLPYVYEHPMARRDIIKLGIDICKALELCQRYNIIHRGKYLHFGQWRLQARRFRYRAHDRADDLGLVQKGHVQLHGSGGLRREGIRLQR